VPPGFAALIGLLIVGRCAPVTWRGIADPLLKLGGIDRGR
jgi:hypothetical protein